MQKLIKQCHHNKLQSGHQKYTLGQLVSCQDCQFQMTIIKCPFLDCNALMYQDKSYIMGNSISCLSCQRSFRQIICKCSNIINDFSKNNYYQGYTHIMCTKCWKNYVIFTCEKCLHHHYLKQSLRLGENIICEKCKTKSIYLLCPFCCQKVTTNQMKFGIKYKCLYSKCQATFSFTVCPYCIEINYSSKDISEKLFDKCFNKQCNKIYVHLNCDQCFQDLYLQSTCKFCQMEQKCPRCKKILELYHCKCGKISLNCKKCPKCLFDTSSLAIVKDPCKLLEGISCKKIQNLDQDSILFDQVDRNCKSCYDKQAKFINISCGHISLCQECYESVQKVGNLKDKCIICKSQGKYKKIYY